MIVKVVVILTYSSRAMKTSVIARVRASVSKSNITHAKHVIIVVMIMVVVLVPPRVIVTVIVILRW